LKLRSYLNTANIHAFIDNAEQPLPAACPGNDSALAAFAQLGLLRLNAQRAFVCLLDRTYSYTIAEATVLSQLRPPPSPSPPTPFDSRDAPEHGLVFCGTATRHAISLPSLVLEAAIESLLSAGESTSLPLPVLVVPDLREDNRFCSLPVLAAQDSLRFCAGVPIRSYNGAFIGVFCLLDSQPRAGLGQVEIQFLRDLSKTIMDHLDSYRLRREFDRSSRMVRGLGSFVEDRTTVAGLGEESQLWSSEGQRGREGALNPLQQETLRQTEREQNPQHATDSYFEEPKLSSATDAKDWNPSSQQHSSQKEPLTGQSFKRSIETWLDQPKHAAESPLHPQYSQGLGDTEEVSASEPPIQAVTTSPPVSGDGLQQLFSRAANIIRESIEVEGVLFFDASVGYWGGLLESGRRGDSEGGSSTTSGTSMTSSSGDDDALPMRSTIRTHTEETTCDVFGFSMTDGSSIDGKKASTGHLTVPERFLRVLLRRYPKGKIFNFTADGRQVSETETDEDFVHAPAPGPAQEPPSRIRRKKYHSYSRANEAALIIRIFPGARSLLAFPLWDSHRERWFAGGVVWTRTPTRVFSIQGELSYLRAFGTVAMAEVARMDAQTANKSKTTLLSSISHELRSPLHGILGGVEILLGTEIDVFQSGVINTVETCGAMLLDTIDHLLTQSEINQSTRMAKLRRDERRHLPRSNNVKEQASVVADTLPNVEIDAIAEEVIEGIFAGYEFMHSSRSLAKPAEKEAKSPSVAVEALVRSREPSPMPIQNNVKVILDIEASASWTFILEAGAVRRIVMNLFGNALKYTTAGYISVTVSQRELPKKRAARSSEIKTEVIITVEDTGKGIGAEYLSNHLFKPFSQEDPLSQGTGLGLSITHQIVASLKGKIDVKSTVGRGTTFSVFLLLSRPVLAEGLVSKGLFLTQRDRTRGLRVSLFGFQEDEGAVSDGDPRADMDWQLPRTSIMTLCRDWLHMEVLAAAETSIRPDVYITTQAGAQHLAAMNKTGTVVQPVVVICPSAAIAHSLTKSAKTLDKFGVFEYLSQP
jgi:signal transduction histidine kinase/GAF domain-containing protein